MWHDQAISQGNKTKNGGCKTKFPKEGEITHVGGSL